MELRRLRLLHELSRLGTVAAVAESLAYSPSSVSVQLAQLEREAGAKLLRRAGRNVELTAAGRRLAARRRRSPPTRRSVPSWRPAATRPPGDCA
jgi:DNA-binding transcriptional LysR family regulator